MDRSAGRNPVESVYTDEVAAPDLTLGQMPTSDFFPADVVRHQTARWRGVRAKTMQIINHEPVEYRFKQQYHLLIAVEQGVCYEAELHRRVADLDRAALLPQADVRSSGANVLRRAAPATADTCDMPLHRPSHRAGRSRLPLRRGRAATSVAVRGCRAMGNRPQAQGTDRLRRSRCSLVCGGARWPPVHRAAASPPRRSSGIKAVATWRACRVATEARHGFHRGAPFRGRFARRARRSGAVEPISFFAILQAILGGAAVSLLDGPADRARQGLAGKAPHIGRRDCGRCGIPRHERVQRYLSSGHRANTYRLSPRPRMTRGSHIRFATVSTD